MALTIKTIVKIYLLFFVFTILLNIFIEIIPSAVPSMSQENQDFINFLRVETNAQIDGNSFNSTSQGESLLSNFKSKMEVTDYFNGGIVSDFLGVLKVIGDMILFIVSLAVSLLFVPTLMTEILLYNFFISSSFIFSVGLIVNIFFYMLLFYIIFKRRIKQ